MKRKSPRTYQESYSPFRRSAKEISDIVHPKQAKENLETEVLFLKDVSIRDRNVLSV